MEIYLDVFNEIDEKTERFTFATDLINITLKVHCFKVQLTEEIIQQINQNGSLDEVPENINYDTKKTFKIIDVDDFMNKSKL